MDVKTVTPREDLNEELNKLDERQIKNLLEYARKLTSRPDEDKPELVLASDRQLCPLWDCPEEDAAWAHL